MFVVCRFKMKDSSKIIPSQVIGDLFEVYQYLYEFNDYYVGCCDGEIYFGVSERYMPLWEDLDEVLQKNVLGVRHLKAFFWLKRNTVYTGESKNANDWGRHPDDFFKYVERILRR